MASVESARALFHIGGIASWKPQYYGTGGRKARLAGLLFAAEDCKLEFLFAIVLRSEGTECVRVDCADTGIVRTLERTELLYTRSQVVIAAKTYGLEAIDMVRRSSDLRCECEV